MVKKLKQSKETGWEDTTRKSETVIRGGCRDNRIKGRRSGGTDGHRF